MTNGNKARPFGVTALSVFFLIGAVISLTASLSLIFPNSFLKPIWRVNPRAQIGFESIGGWKIAGRRYKRTRICAPDTDDRFRSVRGWYYLVL